MEFTVQELQHLVYFLNNCTLNGKESLAHAQLLIKLNQALNKVGGDTNK